MLMLKQRQHFKFSQIFVHWLSALTVIYIIALPLARTFFAEHLGGMGNVFMLHKSLSILVFFLTIIRIFMLINMGRPETLSSPDKTLYRIASKATEGLFYLILLAMPIFGYLMGSQPINFFHLFQIPVMDISDSLRSTFHTLHIYTGWCLIVLISLHICAALFHFFILRDNVLQSMLTSKER